MHLVVLIIAMCNDLWLAGSNLGFDDFFFFFSCRCMYRPIYLVLSTVHGPIYVHDDNHGRGHLSWRKLFFLHRQVCTLHSLGNAWAVVDTFIICGWLVQISNFLIDNVFFFFPTKLHCCYAVQITMYCHVTSLLSSSVQPN